FGPTQIFIVIEIRPQLRILCEELNNHEALAIEPFVHVAASLQEHRFDLSLGCLKSKHAANDRADDSTDNAGSRCHDGWIHCEMTRFVPVHWALNRAISPGLRNILLTSPRCSSSSAIILRAYSSRNMERSRTVSRSLL